MSDNCKIKTLTIRLKVLLNEVVDYNRGSFFGIRAMDPEVLQLWLDYNNILSELDTAMPEVFGDFVDIPYPDPHLAAEDSFYKEGTMIYKPEHFTPLRNQIVKILEILADQATRKTA